MWKNVGYYNGAMGPLEEMTVPMNDRAVYLGDGIYEATCVRNRIPFAIEDHLDRMYNSLRLLQIPFRMSRERVRGELQKAVDFADDSPLHFLYWQVSRGTAPRVHAFPDREVEPNLMITVKPHKLKMLDVPYRLISLEDDRFKLCHIKTLNLIPAVLASQRAKEHGCDECVLHRGSRVTEGAHSNISILKDGVLRTAPCDELILPGITRKHLLALARSFDIPVREEPFSMAELMNADEIIVTASSAMCMRVKSVDGIPVGMKDPEHMKLLQDAMIEEFLRETEVSQKIR